MLFGLCGASVSFCRHTHKVLWNELWKICLSYLDYIIIFRRTKFELLQQLRAVMDRLCSVGLKLKPSKCCFFKTEIQHFGHFVSSKVIDHCMTRLKPLKISQFHVVCIIPGFLWFGFLLPMPCQKFCCHCCTSFKVD